MVYLNKNNLIDSFLYQVRVNEEATVEHILFSNVIFKILLVTGWYRINYQGLFEEYEVLVIGSVGVREKSSLQEVNFMSKIISKLFIFNIVKYLKFPLDSWEL